MLVQLLVKRKGCHIEDYGLCDMVKAKRLRMEAAEGESSSPISLQMLEEWEKFQKSAKMAIFNNTEDGELDLGGLSGSCKYLLLCIQNELLCLLLVLSPIAVDAYSADAHFLFAADDLSEDSPLHACAYLVRMAACIYISAAMLETAAMSCSSTTCH